MSLHYKRQKLSNLHIQKREKMKSRMNSKSLDQQDFNNLLSQGKHFYHEQIHLQKAIKAFGQCLEYSPNHDQALYLYGVCQMQLQNFENATEKLLKISQEYPQKDNAMLLASIALNKMGKIATSYELVSQCIRKSPFFEQAVCFRAKLNIQMNNYLKAQIDFQNAIKINEDSYLGFIGLGDCYHFLKKQQKAIEFYNKSLKVITKLQFQKRIIESEIKLKMAICYFFLQKYQQCREILGLLSLQRNIENSQVYYYYGVSQLKLHNQEKGIHYLQYSIRLATNKTIAERAYKKLILINIQNYHFYEAQNIVKMGKIHNIKVRQWERLVQMFMLVIKNNYSDALVEIKSIYNILKNGKQKVKSLKIDKEDSPINKIIISNQQIKRKRSFQNSYRIKKASQQKHSPFFKRSVDRIQSMRVNAYQYQSIPLKLKFKTQYQQNQQKPIQIFSQKQKQIIFPVLLQFKAYSQFFDNKNYNCIQSIQQYQLYILNHFGLESSIKYNKLVCQIFLLLEAEQPQQALLKCTQTIDFYFNKYGCQPLEPMLYKICIVIKMAITAVLNEQQDSKKEGRQILLSILELIYQKAILHQSPFAQYYTALIFILLEDYEKARECMKSATESSDELIPNIFYSKAINEMKLGYYVSAFKDISASIIIKKTSKAYLAKCLILFHMSEQRLSLKQELLNLVESPSENNTKQPQNKSINVRYIRQGLVQRCLDQLQNYIQCCQDKDQIAINVTKILFACKSFDEALQSFCKIQSRYQADIVKIAQCLCIYSGDFQKGGKVGFIIKKSFDGLFLLQQEEKQLLQKHPLKLSPKDYDYLDSSYQKWLVLLHLYKRNQYNLCIQYLLMLLKQQNLQQTQILLRYNLSIIYLIINNYDSAIQTIKSLCKFDDIFNLKAIVCRISQGNYVKDECLSDLNTEVFVRSSKMLSSYLSYQPIFLYKGKQQINVYARINIPFPSFYRPNLSIQFDVSYILNQLDIRLIPKKIEAPWIKRFNKNIQFTEQLNDTIISFESNQNEEKQLIQKQQDLRQSNLSIL